MNRSLPYARTRAGRAVRSHLLALLGVAGLGAYGALTALYPGAGPFWTAFQNIAEALAAGLATVACALRARREHAARGEAVGVGKRAWIAWSLIAGGLGAWTAGQIGWSVIAVGFGGVPPEVSPLDGAFLLAPVLIVAGLVSMVRTPAGYLSSLRATVQGLFIAAGVLLLSWSLIVGSVTTSTTSSTLATAVNLAYPLLDVVALSAVLFVAFWRRDDPPPGLGLLALGIACLAVSDSSFWYVSEANPNFEGSTPLDTGWVAAFALIAFAALRPLGSAPRRRRRLSRWALLAIPALPAVAGAGAVLLRRVLGAGLGTSVGALVAIMTAVVLVGAALLLSTSYENDVLRRDLERRVRESTAELQATERDRAFHDPLTGLSNRALLDDRAAQAFARSRRTGASVAAIVVDLDAFKLANDCLGYQAGDELLRAVAQRLASVARPEDTVARIGGDEFLVLVDAVHGHEDALALAERLRAAVQPAFALAKSDYSVTLSVGVAVGQAAKTDFEQLLADADVAMYTVKAGGKDAAQLFAPGMHRQPRERLRLRGDLRKALDNDELWLLYEPRYDTVGERLDGFEALVRWNHPTHGLVRPDRFLALAEESGLIVPLGRWVLARALRQAAAWDRIEPGADALSISVNVSPVQLKAPSLLADVRDALDRSAIAPARVVLEIAESSLIEDSHSAIGVLRALKELGVRIAIDDFGTGYASLAHLQRMPVDILKIDRSFVATGGARGRGLLEAIVGIGRTLSLLTVAEGVEQPEQLAMARSIGCDLVQGYLLGRPLPADETRHLIERRCASKERPASSAALR